MPLHHCLLINRYFHNLPDCTFNSGRD
jgi:hypothetical protein